MPKQTLLRIVQEEREEGVSLGPEEIAVMTTAFDRVLDDLNLTRRNDPIVEMIAKLIIELVRNGERDPENLRKQVLGVTRAPDRQHSRPCRPFTRK